MEKGSFDWVIACKNSNRLIEIAIEWDMIGIGALDVDFDSKYIA